jgi:hypothetical protein
MDAHLLDQPAARFAASSASRNASGVLRSLDIRGGDVAGDTNDEEVTKFCIKNLFRPDPRVAATKNGRKWTLVLDEISEKLPAIAQKGLADIEFQRGVNSSKRPSPMRQSQPRACSQSRRGPAIHGTSTLLRPIRTSTDHQARNQ